MKVRLSAFEMYTAATAGVMRQVEALKLGRPDRHGYKGDGWALHINGALAECALAKALNSYWLPVVRRPENLEGDVSDQQVRSTDLPNGCLIVHESDPDSARFWLVLTHEQPEFTIVGSILGAEAKSSQWWRSDLPRPAFFVPQSVLDQ